MTSVYIRRLLTAPYALGMAAALASLSACGLSVPDEEGFSFRVSGWSAIDSAYVSKGRTCHDGPAWNPSITVSDFGMGDRILPAYGGYWGMYSLSTSKKFPAEKPGRWIESDPYAGMDWAKFTDWKDYAALKTWWLRWHFPATGKKPMDMVAFDLLLKKVPLHPTTSWRYRVCGSTKGRAEIKFGLSEEYMFFEDWRVFGAINLWYIDYRNENRAKVSGLSSGDLSLGLGWKWLYVKATYWFQLDKHVLRSGHDPYDYDENLILSAGFRFAF